MSKFHPSELPPDQRVAMAKSSFLAAAYSASPVRSVEAHPLLSVTAVASIAMAVTIVAGEPLVRSVGGGLATHGLGILGTILRSPWATMLLQRVAPQNVSDGARGGGV